MGTDSAIRAYGSGHDGSGLALYMGVIMIEGLTIGQVLLSWFVVSSILFVTGCILWLIHSEL